ncbi:MAG TPA: hypothetical protein VML55_06350, partial [Planctomycetaceae bacterium]|nr:hypothetical protein [Planctomycetaceae bacterium]
MGRWPRSVRDGSWIWLLAAVGLAYLFWQPLWHGAGLIGGDVYSYFLPQKTWYASRLDAGEFPLWNPLVGHGYPLLGESQTAAFSPFNLAAYRLFDVNTAYNVVQLAHYVLCFVFTWLLARRLELSRPAAGLAAIVFTFAWFPPRITLEWAITTGTWLPAAAWCVESYLVTRRLRYALGLSVVLALQMLAGHYNLAFITQVTLIVYTAARLLLAPRRTDFQSVHSAERPRSQTTGRTGSPSDGGTAASHVAPRLEGRQAGRPSPRVRATLVLGGALIAGFGLAAVQLAPSWELKQLSQRASVGRHHEPGELHIPVRAWSQLVVPWEWFTETEDPFPALLPAGAPKTNRTEAHLYFGLVPLALVAFAILGGLWWRDRRWRIWAVLGAGTLIYATGWLVPVTRHLPGFSFFLGPARFSLVTTLAAALLAAAALDCVLGRARRAAAFVLAVLVLTATAGDLLLVSEALRGKVYWILQTPGPELIDASPVRRVLAGADQPVRVFGR